MATILDSPSRSSASESELHQWPWSWVADITKNTSPCRYSSEVPSAIATLYAHLPQKNTYTTPVVCEKYIYHPVRRPLPVPVTPPVAKILSIQGRHASYRTDELHPDDHLQGHGNLSENDPSRRTQPQATSSLQAQQPSVTTQTEIKTHIRKRAHREMQLAYLESVCEQHNAQPPPLILKQLTSHAANDDLAPLSPDSPQTVLSLFNCSELGAKPASQALCDDDVSLRSTAGRHPPDNDDDDGYTTPDDTYSAGYRSTAPVNVKVSHRTAKRSRATVATCPRFQATLGYAMGRLARPDSSHV